MALQLWLVLPQETADSVYVIPVSKAEFVKAYRAGQTPNGFETWPKFAFVGHPTVGRSEATSTDRIASTSTEIPSAAAMISCSPSHPDYRASLVGLWDFAPIWLSCLTHRLAGGSLTCRAFFESVSNNRFHISLFVSNPELARPGFG